MAGYVVSCPEAKGAIVIDRAVRQIGNERAREVSVPPSAADRRSGQRSERAAYRIRFDLPAVPDDPLAVLIPSTSQGFSLTLNGEQIFRSDVRALWSEP